MAHPAAAATLFGTFDAERFWQAPGPGALPEVAARPTAAALASADELLIALSEPGDTVLCHREPAPGLLDRLDVYGPRGQVRAVAGQDGECVEARLARRADEVRTPGNRARPYAVIPVTADALRALGIGEPCPTPEAAASANSKLWSNDFCARRGLPGAAAVVRDSGALEAAAAALDGPLVLKSAHGVAGRGSLLVQDHRVLRGIGSRLDKTGDTLLVQQLYGRAVDFSAHLDVEADGSATLVGLRGMTCRGLAFARSDTLAEPVAERLRADCDYARVLRELGAELAEAGYFGPASVDGMITEDGVLVPVLEVNARLSMGRVGLALERRAPAGRVSLGSFSAPVAEPYDVLDARLDAAVRASGLAWEGSGSGVVLLTGATMQPPTGRVYWAAHGGDEEQIAHLVASLRDVLADAGFAGRAGR